MLCRYHRNVWFRQEDFCVQRLVFACVTRESNIRGTVTKSAQQRAGLELAQSQFDFGKALTIFAQHSRQYCQHGRREEAHSERAHFAAPNATRVMHIFSDFAKCLLCALQQLFAGSGQSHITGRS